MPPATPLSGPPTTAASINSRLTAPTCIAMASPAISPAENMRDVVTRPAALRNLSRRKTETIAAMDATDSEILRLLREDGRLSWRELGAAVGLSANAAADRVRRLRQAGVILGFVALIDPAAGGRHVEALIGVTLARGTDSDAFAVLASRLEPVTEVLHLSGAPDYQLRVACRDTAELDALLRTLRNRAGAADTETTIVLRSGPPRTFRAADIDIPDRRA